MNYPNQPMGGYGQQIGYPQYQNPYSGYQQRLNYLEQQQMTQMQPQPQLQQPVQQMILKGMPVSSEQDARKAQIDFDGSVSIYPDFTNGYIYTKQLDLNDCTPVFNRYKLVVDDTTQSKQPVTREEFDNLNSQVQTVIAFLTGGINNATVKSNDVYADVPATESTTTGVVATDNANGKRKNTRTTATNGE